MAVDGDAVIGLFASLIVVAGLLLMLAGLLGIWLAMNSPIQLQPIPLIVLVAGFVVVVFGVLLVWSP